MYIYIYIYSIYMYIQTCTHIFHTRCYRVITFSLKVEKNFTVLNPYMQVLEPGISKSFKVYGSNMLIKKKSHWLQVPVSKLLEYE